MILQWTDESLSPRARQISKNVFTNITGEGTGGYGNFCDSDVGRGREKVVEQFGTNHERLAAIKQKYNPENIFNRWFAIAPA